MNIFVNHNTIIRDDDDDVYLNRLQYRIYIHIYTYINKLQYHNINNDIYIYTHIYIHI